MSKKSKKIEKPWAVYFSDEGAVGVGKVIQEDKYFEMIIGLSIVYHEKDNYHDWDPRYVKTFDTPVKAIAYFLVHSPHSKREDTIRHFLRGFPSERANLENLLAQSQPKCPWAEAHGRYQRDEGPFGPNPFRKDDGFIHPNIKS